MAFWGIELKPGKPYIHRYDSERGMLHVSQATLGADSSTKKGIVQCKVGDKRPIYLCSLLPEILETCALNLEFKEEDEVTFSIVGPHTVHLSGFFHSEDEDQDSLGDDNCCNPFEEDIMGMESEDEDGFIGYDSEDVDDDYSDDDLTMNPSFPVPNRGVKIEELVDDGNPSNEYGVSKRSKKKKRQSCTNDNQKNSDLQIVSKSGTGASVLEEDEDGFPISACKSKVEISNSKSKSEQRDNPEGVKAQGKKANDNVSPGKNLKRKIDAAGQDKECTRKENKKKKKQNKNQESAAKPNTEQSIKDKNGAKVEKEEKTKAKQLQVKSFPNGLVIEDLAISKTNGKSASSGKKVSVHYIGKLKKNGKIFDSNIGRAPFQFRLGAGEVIKGWDVGINGMRVGDKRRLTIPPAVGYGSKGAGGAIPPSSWLIFDVELVGVK